MLKKISVILLMIIISVTFIGCGSKEETSIKNTENSISIDESIKEKNDKYQESKRFKPIDDKNYVIGSSRYYIYYDTVTKIVYLQGDYFDHPGGLSVMYDSDGKPMTLDKYNQTKDNSLN